MSVSLVVGGKTWSVSIAMAIAVPIAMPVAVAIAVTIAVPIAVTGCRRIPMRFALRPIVRARLRIVLTMPVGLVVRLATAKQRHQHEQPPGHRSKHIQVQHAKDCRPDLHPLSNPRRTQIPPHPNPPHPISPQDLSSPCAQSMLSWRQGRNTSAR